MWARLVRLLHAALPWVLAEAATTSQTRRRPWSIIERRDRFVARRWIAYNKHKHQQRTQHCTSIHAQHNVALHNPTHPTQRNTTQHNSTALYNPRSRHQHSASGGTCDVRQPATRLLFIVRCSSFVVRSLFVVDSVKNKEEESVRCDAVCVGGGV